jgi:thiol:disulfide interchange protein DsbD
MNISKTISLLVIMSLAVLFLASGGCSNSEVPQDSTAQIKWIHSVSEGLALAKQEGKPAVIDFYADWCPPCQKMEKTTFREKQVIEELARFVTIKADLTNSSSKGQSAAKEYGVQVIPTYVFIDTQGKQTVRSGYMPTESFLMVLENIK